MFLCQSHLKIYSIKRDVFREYIGILTSYYTAKCINGTMLPSLILYIVNCYPQGIFLHWPEGLTLQKYHEGVWQLPMYIISLGKGSRKKTYLFSGQSTKAFSPPPLRLSGQKNFFLSYNSRKRILTIFFSTIFGLKEP